MCQVKRMEGKRSDATVKFHELFWDKEKMLYIQKVYLSRRKDEYFKKCGPYTTCIRISWSIFFFFIKYRIPGLNLFSPENELFDGAEYFKVHQVTPPPKKEKIDDNTFLINRHKCKKIGKIQRNAADAPQSNDCF